jgi:hypothetical protein
MRFVMEKYTQNYTLPVITLLLLLVSLLAISCNFCR